MDNIQQIEWWTPEARPAYVLWTEDGGREEGPMLEADEVICDCCNGDVLTNPAPLVGGNALCDDCFKEMFGISVEEAARQAGVTLNRTDGGEENKPGETYEVRAENVTKFTERMAEIMKIKPQEAVIMLTWQDIAEYAYDHIKTYQDLNPLEIDPDDLKFIMDEVQGDLEHIYGERDEWRAIVDSLLRRAIDSVQHEKPADRCDTCSGTGLISCPECQGDGRVSNMSGCGDECGGWADRCDTCSGTGLVSCPECHKNKEEA